MNRRSALGGARNRRNLERKVSVFENRNNKLQFERNKIKKTEFEIEREYGGRLGAHF